MATKKVHACIEIHPKHRRTCIFLPFWDSRMMVCNYFFNSGPCVYRNVNVRIITGSTARLRMSSLSGCQSLLKIAGQISMRCCHGNWQTESAAAFKLTNIRAVHGRNYSIKEKTEKGWPFHSYWGKERDCRAFRYNSRVRLDGERLWEREREKRECDSVIKRECDCKIAHNEVLHNTLLIGLPFAINNKWKLPGRKQPASFLTYHLNILRVSHWSWRGDGRAVKQIASHGVGRENV